MYVNAIVLIYIVLTNKLFHLVLNKHVSKFLRYSLRHNTIPYLLPRKNTIIISIYLILPISIIALFYKRLTNIHVIIKSIYLRIQNTKTMTIALLAQI